jgi:uncharacterized protein (DUF1697 family)
MKYVALVRALNVGGTGKLTMKDLVACCTAAGMKDVSTYIASGNAIFTSALPEAKVKAAIEKALSAKMGAKIDVFVRTHDELVTLVKKNPFAQEPGNQVIVMFGDEAPSREELAVKGPAGETLRAVGRDVVAYYPMGVGQSKLKLPFAKRVTGRNANTVAKLAGLTS